MLKHSCLCGDETLHPESPGRLERILAAVAGGQSHKFEGSVSPNGWIGLALKTSEEFQETEPMSLVVWVVSKTALSIDKFHQIEKINV